MRDDGPYVVSWWHKDIGQPDQDLFTTKRFNTQEGAFRAAREMFPDNTECAVVIWLRTLKVSSGDEISSPVVIAHRDRNRDLKLGRPKLP